MNGCSARHPASIAHCPEGLKRHGRANPANLRMRRSKEPSEILSWTPRLLWTHNGLPAAADGLP
jgi:hypothetical protein